MDKSLEIVLVAATLVVAAVIVISMLQGQSGSFEGFANDQTDSASCGLGYQQWKQSIECGGDGAGDKTSRSTELETEYDSCGWTDNVGSNAVDEVC